MESSGGSDPLTEFNRAIRPGVLWRKGSCGTQSAEGSRVVETMMTVVATRPGKAAHQLGGNMLGISGAGPIAEE